MIPKNICCPKCGTSEGLTLYVEAFAEMTVSEYKKGNHLPDGFFRDVQVAGDKTLVRYSDKKGAARLVFFNEEETALSVYCPNCDKVYTIEVNVDATP